MSETTFPIKRLRKDHKEALIKLKDQMNQRLLPNRDKPVDLSELGRLAVEEFLEKYSQNLDSLVKKLEKGTY